MKVLVTGANGFVGQNLVLHLSERKEIIVVPFTRNNNCDELPALLCDVDFIFHLGFSFCFEFFSVLR
jgi:UDP-2-acetamido-2,6-beta-L-arabino-hexul-4-ose reductase